MIQIKLFNKIEWFSAILIALFIKIFVLFEITTKYNFRSPDSESYLLLSKNLAGSYFNEENKFYGLSLIRTPGYPFLLNIFSSSIFKIVLVQIFLSIAISVVLVLIVNMLLGTNSKKISLFVFFISQIETSLFVYSYKILTELLFAFLFTLFIYLLLLLKNAKNLSIFFVITFILVFLILVRPIGIVFVITFMILIFIGINRRLYALLFVISLLVLGTYSFHNFSRSGIFTMSTIQNHNLLMYEAAGARSITTGISISVIQNDEYELQKSVLGETPTAFAIDRYNFNRGIELILDNKISLIRLHLVGVPKILFGPNKFELNQLFSAISPTFESGLLNYLVEISSLLITFFISLFGFVGACFLIKHKETRFLSMFLFVYLLFTSGANAYGRFRAPIAPILIIFTTLFIYEVYKKRNINNRPPSQITS
jgi:hypothetical protein